METQRSLLRRSRQKVAPIGYFSAVVGKRPLWLAPLERALSFFNDMRVLHLHLSLGRERKKPAGYDVVLTLRQRRFSSFAYFDNRGRELLGPLKMQISGGAIPAPATLTGCKRACSTRPTARPTCYRPKCTITRWSQVTDRVVTFNGVYSSAAVREPDVSKKQCSGHAYAMRITSQLLRSRDQPLWLGTGFVALKSRERDSVPPLFDDYLRILSEIATYAGHDPAHSVDKPQIVLNQGLGALGAPRPGCRAAAPIPISPRSQAPRGAPALGKVAP